MRNKAGNELTRKLGPIQINSVFLRSYEEGPCVPVCTVNITLEENEKAFGQIQDDQRKFRNIIRGDC